MNNAQTLSPDVDEDVVIPESSTSQGALWSEIEEIYEAETEAHEYNSFKEQCVGTKETRSKLPDLSEITKATEAVNGVFSFSIDEISEDSENFDFSVYKTIKCFNTLSIMIFENLIDSGKINHIYAVALLSFLGRINDPETLMNRMYLLKKCLNNKSRFVREGARLGLLYSQNPKVIPFLEEAIKNETSDLLREKLSYTISVLER